MKVCKVVGVTEFTDLRVKYLEMLMRVAEDGERSPEQLFDRIERLLGFDEPRWVDAVVAPPHVAELPPAPESSRTQRPLKDLPADAIPRVEAVSEPAPADISPGMTPGRELTPGVSAVPCVAGKVHHKWGSPDEDGWHRCLRRCGAGRPPIYGVEGKRVRPPAEVPSLVDGEPIHREQPTTGDRDALFARADGEPVSEPVSEPTAAADGDWGDFGAQPDIELEPARAASVLDDGIVEDDDEEELVPRGGGRILEAQDLAPLVGRDDTPARLVRTAPCTRCATGQLARDTLEPNDPTAYACLVCGHRPRLTREQAAELERELRDPSKLRQREPTHGGMRL